MRKERGKERKEKIKEGEGTDEGEEQRKSDNGERARGIGGDRRRDLLNEKERARGEIRGRRRK